MFGNFGVQNLGDELILQGFLELQKQRGNEVVVFCGGDRSAPGRDFGVRYFKFFPGGIRSAFRWLGSSAYRKSLREGRELLRSCGRIYVGGGGILVDRQLKAVALWLAQLRVIRGTGVPYEFIANSMELRRSWSGKLFLPYLKAAERVGVRDLASREFLKGRGISAELEDDLAYQVRLPRGPLASRRKKIVLALCQWGLGPPQRQVLKRFVQRRRQQGYDVVGLVFQSSGDDDRRVYEGFGIPVITGFDDVMDQLASSRLLLGMRFHSLVLAERLQVSSLALAYQDKVEHFMRDRGLDQRLFNLSDLHQEQLEKVFQKVIDEEREGL